MTDKIKVDFRDKKLEELETRVAELEEKLTKARADAEQISEEYLRKAADLDNTRKRLLREELEIRERAAERIIRQILPVLADLTRAIDETDADPAVPEHHVEAIRMLDQKIFDILRNEGLEPIAAAPGLAFDPAVHDAVMGERRPELEPNTIIKVLEPGYALKGRLLAPAKVLVCLEEETPPEATPRSETGDDKPTGGRRNK